MLAAADILDHEDVDALQSMPYAWIEETWADMLAADTTGSCVARDLARHDRFFLLTQLLHRPDALHPWLYARCREVEAAPDDHLDLWSREHYKSSFITFAGVIQEILRNPEITVGIFSFNKPTARKFLRQIKYELETNAELKGLFPEILWDDPKRESPRWSEDGGIVVKRQGNPKEATVEGHGLVDGQPTGAHFLLRVYDDVVTLESVTSPEMVKKTTEAWSLSDNLGARGEDGRARCQHVGTRYSFRDTYQDMLDMSAVTPRIYPATDNGLPDGNPVFLSPEVWREKRRKQISSVLAAQMLQNPAAGNEATFKQEWLKFIDIRPATLNIYILCDPASSKKKGSDSTAIPVVGIDSAGNKWLVDGACHKMGLAERWQALRGFRRKWLRMPGVQMVRVGYERYGSTADLEHFEEQMRLDKDACEIVELAWPRERPGARDDRIQGLDPEFRDSHRYLPASADRRPLRPSAAYRIFSTDTPAASTIAGFSPAARSRRPKRVRYSSHHTAATASSAP